MHAIRRTAPLLAPALLLAGVLAGLPARSATGGPPPGYYVDSAQAREWRPARRDRPGDAYTYTIRRGYADSTDGRLLAIAEAIYPPRDLLIALAQRRNLEMGSDTARAMLWWCDGPGLRRVPYAVTAGAVEHYANLIDELKDETVLRPGAPHPLYAGLQYMATIAERDSFVAAGALRTGVHVAHLTLLWSWDDGVFFTAIEADRTVVLSAGGAVLAVEGDGAAREEVSISDGIGIGRRSIGPR